ncbi:MAG: Mur ligase family protein [Candidatus Babeliales bacterium]
MNGTHTIVGVWGYGIVGKSIAQFLAPRARNQEIVLVIGDARQLHGQETEQVREFGTWMQLTHKDTIEHFLDTVDLCYVSAGIDVRPYQKHAHKFASELDLFAQHFKKPIIAITGTVGKTTCTTLITALLCAAGYRAVSGGNIGVGLCDLIVQQDRIDYAVIEVSSFQLELARSFAPQVALITNIYPNHLDRHDSFEAYVSAKISMVRRQTGGNCVIVNEAATAWVPETRAQVRTFNRSEGDPLSTIFDAAIVPENRAAAAQVLAALQVPLPISRFGIAPLPHRMQIVAVVQGVTFINDSKSTIEAATITAVTTCNAQGAKPIVLIGGLSKGVDRRRLIGQLMGHVTQLICFGAEAVQLASYCHEYGIVTSAHDTLEAAFTQAVTCARVGDTVLLSPAGSSYDLFDDYAHRGRVFMQLVDEYMRKGM